VRRHPLRPSRRGSRAGSRGVILIVGLLFLLAIILLSLAMVRGVGLQERTAGGTRDKERSFEAAQGALEYGEWWLSTGGGGAFSVVCSTQNNPINALAVCSNPLSVPATTPWAAWTTYQPSTSMNIAAGGGVGSNGDVNYQAAPGLYVSYIGLTPDGTGTLYQVSAFSGGGSADTMSVVQSTYKLQTAARDLGGL
jgi:type IV pilus assembly protein PilX